MNPRLQIVVLRQCIVRIFRYMANHPEAWVLLILLFFVGARLRPDFRTSSNAFWLAPFLLGISTLCIYAIVNVEDRYLSASFFLILLPVFAAARISPTTENTASNDITARTAASAAVILLALLALGESARIVGQLRRDLVFIQYPAGWYDRETFHAAHALNDLGVGPGDTIACIGTRACLYDHYWARLAGVRILTEIYYNDRPLDPWFAGLHNREQAYDTLRREGAKVLVGYFEPGLMNSSNPIAAGWHELDETQFYALPLNLPPTPTENPHP